MCVHVHYEREIKHGFAHDMILVCVLCMCACKSLFLGYTKNFDDKNVFFLEQRPIAYTRTQRTRISLHNSVECLARMPIAVGERIRYSSKMDKNKLSTDVFVCDACVHNSIPCADRNDPLFIRAFSTHVLLFIASKFFFRFFENEILTFFLLSL